MSGHLLRGDALRRHRGGELALGGVPERAGAVSFRQLDTANSIPRKSREHQQSDPILQSPGFFTAKIRYPNTRRAYRQAVRRFCDWCQERGFRLERLTPVHIAAYVEQLGKDPTQQSTNPLAKPSMKQRLAAIRTLFGYLVIGQVVPYNPAASVRCPQCVLKTARRRCSPRRKPALLFDAIDQKTDEHGRRVMKEPSEMTIAELRDRALIGVMVYSFARIGAALGKNVEDCLL
jgi:integrase/recombinase XerD